MPRMDSLDGMLLLMQISREYARIFEEAGLDFDALADARLRSQSRRRMRNYRAAGGYPAERAAERVASAIEDVAERIIDRTTAPKKPKRRRAA